MSTAHPLNPTRSSRPLATASPAYLRLLVDRAATLLPGAPGGMQLRREAAAATRALAAAGRLPRALVVTEHDPYPLVVRTLARAASVAAESTEEGMTWETSGMAAG